MIAQPYQGHNVFEKKRLYSDGLGFMKYLEIEQTLEKQKKIMDRPKSNNYVRKKSEYFNNTDFENKKKSFQQQIQ